MSSVVTSTDIIRHVALDYGVSVDTVLGRRRRHVAALPRHVAMYLMRDILGMSFPAISRVFLRHHTTALSACEAVTNRISKHGDTRERVARIREALLETPSNEEPTCIGCLQRERKLRELRALVTSAHAIVKGDS